MRSLSSWNVSKFRMTAYLSLPPTSPPREPSESYAELLPAMSPRTSAELPLTSRNVSWPPKESVACNVVDSLGEADREMTLGWEHNILKDADGIHDYVSSQQSEAVP